MCYSLQKKFIVWFQFFDGLFSIFFLFWLLRVFERTSNLFRVGADILLECQLSGFWRFFKFRRVNKFIFDLLHCQQFELITLILIFLSRFSIVGKKDTLPELFPFYNILVIINEILTPAFLFSCLHNRGCLRYLGF